MGPAARWRPPRNGRTWSSLTGCCRASMGSRSAGGFAARASDGKRLGLRRGRVRPHRRHPRPPASEKARRRRRSGRDRLGDRLPLLPASRRLMRLFARLRTQLIVSHLAAIAFTLIAMVGAVVFIGTTWFAGQQGATNEPTQAARVVASAMGGMVAHQVRSTELNVVLR